jgi:hypothetical protein
MKESEIYSQVSQKVREFESLEDIQPSSDWNQSLMARLATSKVHPGPEFPTGKSALALTFIILINIGVILSMISNNNRQSFSRSNDLEAISKEFLINPTSISE